MSAQTEFEPSGASFEALYGFLSEVRETEPVFFSQKHHGWVITRYDDLVEVVRSPNFTVENALQGAQNGQYCPAANQILAKGVDWNKTRHVQTDDGPDHARFRKALMSVVTPRRIREMQPVVRDLANRLIDNFIARGRCEYVGEFAYPLAMLTVLNLIGFTEAEEDMDKFRIWIDDTFRLLLATLDDDQQVAAAENAVAFQNHIRSAIADRRNNPRGDLLSDILEQLSSGQAQLSEDELVVMFTHSFVGAGNETTKLALTNSIYHLLSDLSRWQQVLDHPERIDEVVEECLRFDAPLLAWYRYCAEDTEIGGKLIKKGDKVVIMYGSANHDAGKIKDAAQFCPFREEKVPHLTFNTGKHFCVGAPLARLELNLALELLSQRIPNLRLKPDQVITYAPTFGQRNIPELHLEWPVA